MNQNETAARRIQQFDAKHGDDGIVLNGWMVFSDGAKREAHNTHGALIEPPNDQHETEEIKLQYQEEMLRRATENVKRRRQAAMQQAQPRKKTASELVEEFDKKHSQDGAGIRDGGLFIYPNGAYRDVSTMGVLAEPYNDPWRPLELENRIVRYWELALNAATDRFNEQRNSWLRQSKVNLSGKITQAPPEVPAVAVRRLKVLKMAVQKAQIKLDEARKKLEDAKPQWMRERQETSSMHRGVNEEFITKIENIQI